MQVDLIYLTLDLIYQILTMYLKTDFCPIWRVIVNTDYSIAPLWRSRIVSDSLIIPLGFESSPGHEIYNCGSPLKRSIDSLSAIAILT